MGSGRQASIGFAGEVGTIRLQGFGVPLAVAIDHHDLLFDPPAHVRRAEGKHALDTALEVSGHPVRAAHEDDRLGSCVLEAEQAAVLEEAAQEAAHADVLAQAGLARHEATDAPNHEVDLHPRCGGPV